MSITNKRIVGNALANIASGSASAVMALILPPILVRYLSTEVYGAWSLVLQIGAYTGYLNFGIQIAVGRFVAHHTELENRAERNRIVSTAFVLLCGAACLGLVMVGVLTWLMPTIFTKMPLAMVNEARIALLLVGGSLALGLPFNATNAIFIGLQRNSVPARIAIVSKSVLAIMLALTVVGGGQLLGLAVAFATINLLSYLWQWYVYKHEAGFVEISARFFGTDSVRELVEYCASLTVWTVAMLLITGLDSTIVGIFDFKAVAFFTVATNLIMFYLGFQNAIISPLIPAGAALSASGTPGQVGHILLKSTRLGIISLLLTGLPIIVFAEQILTAWVGKEYALGGTGILQLLIAGNMIRLMASPYAMLLIATGRQRAVLLTPCIEGIVNISASVLFASWFGAIGVAIGTIIGSIAGLLGNWLVNMPRTQDKIAFPFRDYLLQGVLKPVSCFVPVLAYGVCTRFAWCSWQDSNLVLSLVAVLVIVAVTLFGLDFEERKSLIAKCKLTFASIMLKIV